MTIETELRRQILTLWQTALIRLSRLKIQDEIEVGLRYYPAAFFEVIPKVNAEVRARTAGPLARRRPARPSRSCVPGRGSAVTATATRTSPPTWCGWPPAAPPTPRSAHYFAELTAARAGAVDVGAAGEDQRRRWSALAEACDEPARADEPYRRALRVVHARLTATAQQILDRNPSTCSTSGMQPLRHARRSCWPTSTSSTPRCAANGSALLADDRLARLREAVRRLRFSPQRAWTCGRTPTCTRRSSPNCWRGPACTPTTRRCPSRSGSSCWWPNWPPGARWSATTPSCPSWPARNSTSCAAAARAVQVFGPQAVPNYIISMCQSVSDMLEAAILLKEVGLLDVSGRDAYARSASCRCSRRSTTCSAARRSSSRAGSSALPRAWCTPAATARRSCSATPTPTRTAAIWRPTGRCTGPSSTSSSPPARPESGCGSSTVAAAPSAAAVGPSYDAILAQPPGAVNGSLRITEQGEVIAAKYAEPRIAHRNLETLLAATLESTLLDIEGLGDAAGPAYEVLDDLAARAQRAYAELVHETPGFVEYFKASTPVSEIGVAQHRQPADVAQAHHVDRRPAGHPVGAGLEPVAGHAARLVRHRHRVRGVDRRGRRAARGAAGPVPALAVLPHRAVEHGAGAGQVRYGPGGALFRAGRRRGRCGSGCSTRSSPSTTAPSGCTS